MKLEKLSPAFKDYLWGGTKLRDVYGKNCDFDKVAESWELSTHPAGQSKISGGEYDGLTLEEEADRLAQLEQREQELEDSATDQVSINRISGEVYEMWDAELNYVYQQLKATLTEEEFQLLKEEELEWIEYRDQQADAAAEEWAGGSGMPMAVNSALSEVTKARVYELADRWISGWRP